MNKLDVRNDYYIDVTDKWLMYAKPNSHKVKELNYFLYKEIRYYVDGKNVVLDYSKEELEIAKWLENTFGGEIFMLPRINIPKGIKTADYLWNGEYWDLKILRKEAASENRAIDNIIKTAKGQANNFILDVSKTYIKRTLIQKQIEKLFISKEREWIDKVILIDRNINLKIYSRIKKAVPLQAEWERLFEKYGLVKRYNHISWVNYSIFFVLCQIKLKNINTC